MSFRWLGLFIFLGAVSFSGVALYQHFGIKYYLQPPFAKLMTTWRADIKRMSQVGDLPKEWAEIKEIQINGDSTPPIQDWLERLQSLRKISADQGAARAASDLFPIQTNPNGKYRLEVFLVHWIEGYRYGVMMQYHLVNLANMNTVWELDRTYKLGIVY